MTKKCEENYKKIELILSILAIIISVVSIRCSCVSNDKAEVANSIAKEAVRKAEVANSIAREANELAIEPILKVDFKISYKEDKQLIEILNDGALPIYEIEIIVHQRILDTEHKSVTNAIISRKPWKEIAEIAPRESIPFPIDKDYFKTALLLLSEAKNNSRAYILFQIKFKRGPDRKKYELHRYLSVNPSSQGEGLIFWDVDKDGVPRLREMKKYLAEYDEIALPSEYLKRDRVTVSERDRQ